jgi:hypothetical protein
MGKFRKKPVVVEAWQIGKEKTLPDFVRDTGILWFFDEELTIVEADIPTLEGTMHADPGDWIIKGVKGEFYPCKPDIFAATYEPVEEAPS